MFGVLFRALWRILVGLVALGLAFLTRYLVFPYLDDRMPMLLAIAILYLLAAYIGIPFLVRMWHLVIKPNHLPIYATSQDGWSSDPVNVAIVCESGEQLIKAMEQAGWHQADKATPRTALRLCYAMLFGRSYPNAPFSSLFLFGRPQDIGFQIQTGNPPTPRHRHHIRLWQLDTSIEPGHIHQNFWQVVLQLFTRKKRQIWIGSATHDVKPFAFRAQNLQVTHGIDPETNLERDFVVHTLADKKMVRRVETITTGEPLQFRGQAFGVRIVVDGKLKVIELKKIS
jgi:hypothetical protein